MKRPSPGNLAAIGLTAVLFATLAATQMSALSRAPKAHADEEESSSAMSAYCSSLAAERGEEATCTSEFIDYCMAAAIASDAVPTHLDDHETLMTEAFDIDHQLAAMPSYPAENSSDEAYVSYADATEAAASSLSSADAEFDDTASSQSSADAVYEDTRDALKTAGDAYASCSGFGGSSSSTPE